MRRQFASEAHKHNGRFLNATFRRGRLSRKEARDITLRDWFCVEFWDSDLRVRKPEQIRFFTSDLHSIYQSASIRHPVH